MTRRPSADREPQGRRKPSTGRPDRGRSDRGRPQRGRSGVRPQQGIRGVDRARTSKTSDHGLGGAQIEGRQAVRELLIAGKRRVIEIWISDDLDDNPVIDDIVDLASDQRVPVRRVKRKDIEREARSEAPQGILAKAEPLQDVELAELLRDSPKPQFFVAVDGVTDPGNLGAILRSCDGAGVTGVILPRHRAVHITPTAAKAAAGAAEHVPMCVVGGLPTALKQMKDAGVWVIGLHDAAERTVFEMGSLAKESVCIVLGAEGAGLSRLVRERCDMLIRIPMLGALSSLNVSVAAALATYEVVRARRNVSPE
ncbi:MAG: 23S rRNA (guanosine(2251)-2'-O)-methyltransferase RlmB [Ilumatobacteraceae bacterium]